MIDRRLFLGAAACAAFPFIPASPVFAATERLFTAAQLREDFDQFLATVRDTHPDLGFSTDLTALDAAATRIRRRLDRSMDVRQAWLEMARINPVFRDAHVGLRQPVDDYESYRRSGGATFDVPVFLDRAGRLRVAETIASASRLKPFEEVVAINGSPVAGIIDALGPRMRGETPSLQRFVLTYNFASLLWTLHGARSGYEVRTVDSESRTRVFRLGANDGGGGPLDPARAISLQRPGPGVAVLRVRSFDPSLKTPFAAFVESTFARLKTEGVRTLCIDVRDNPGGAHDLSDLIVARLARRPAATASRLVARITEANREVSPGAAIGSVVTTPWNGAVTPQSPGFEGRTYVLVSRDTYSQAIVFATTLKDHGLATVVGETTGGNANQTGQITPRPLTHTRLQALAPVYVIYRPSGDERPGGLAPDIPLPHDPSRPEAMVDALLRRIA